jgi:hypothetical protein
MRMPLLISVIVLTISLNQHGVDGPISAKLKTYTLFTIIQSLLSVFIRILVKMYNKF